MSLSQLRSSAPLRLFAVSWLLLFAEVMCIRWLGIEVPLLQVFPAMVLTTIFIGTSAGLATYTKPLPSTSLLLFSSVTTLIFLISANYLPVEKLSLLDSTTIVISLLVLGLLVVNLTIAFLAIGRSMGTEFARMPALKAYSANLAGSIAGVLAFAIISWLWLPPALWLLICGALAWFLTGKKYIPVLAIVLAASAMLACPEGTVWSPYGKIRTVPAARLFKDTPDDGSYVLFINGHMFHGGQTIQPGTSLQELADKLKGQMEWTKLYRMWVEIPFYMSTAHDNMLVLGAGSGSDVAVALQHNAKHIDAVERDAYIATCGRDKHPNKPFADARVSTHVADARTFLRYSKDKYDLIQFAYLDPGVTLKLSSFLRSDNFVYTKESIESALARLNDHGIISVSFATGGDSPVTRRLYKTIADANNHKPPFALVQDYTGSCFFLFGPGLKESGLPPEIYKLGGLRPWPGKGEYSDTKTSTDDWPFLYLEFTVVAVILYFCVLTSAAVLPLTVIIKEGLSGKLRFNEAGPMILLGLAFMLMETKSITQLSLLYGATWIVSAVVIFTILLLACLSNWLVDRFNIRDLRIGYSGLVCTLLLDYFWKVPAHSDMAPLMLAGISAFVVCLPVFFGGMVFSILLARAGNSVMSLSANVIGVAFGGLLEHVCIVYGIRSLSLLALALYLSSAIPLLFGKRQPPSTD